MSSFYILMLSPLLSLSGNVIIYMLAIHIKSRFGLSLLYGVISGLIVNGGLLIHLMLNHSEISIVDIATSITTYITLSFCFWAFLNLNITSLRIRLAQELLSKKKQGLSDEELSQHYSPEELVRRRIDRLATSGQIVQHNGKWKLNNRWLILFERIFSMLNQLIIPRSPDNYT